MDFLAFAVHEVIEGGIVRLAAGAVPQHFHEVRGAEERPGNDLNARQFHS